MRINRISIVVLLCMLSLSTQSTLAGAVNFQKFAKGGMQIRTANLRVRFNSQGIPTQIGRLDAQGKLVWNANMPEDESWRVLIEKENGKQVWFNTAMAKHISVESSQDNQGVTIQTTFIHAQMPISITLKYQVLNQQDDRLRMNWSYQNQTPFLQFIRLFFANVNQLPVGPDKWVARPYHSGLLERTDTIVSHERPAPGLMWMQWIGYLDGDNGLLSYCEDLEGSLKFVNANRQKKGGLIMSWCDRFGIRKFSTRHCSYDYVLVPMATPNGINDLCAMYAKWGRQQHWFVKASEKIKARPQLKQVIEQGIVKTTGFGALSQSLTKWVPVKGYIPLEEKIKMVRQPRSYQRNLDDIRKVDRMYGIHPAIRHDGWYDRFDARYPYVLPVNKKLGNDADFVRYISENNSDQRAIILHLNPVQFDTDCPQFNPKQMVLDYKGKMPVTTWSGNRLALASPKLVIGENLSPLLQLNRWNVQGVFWDVIGGTSPTIDMNPEAHYANLDGSAFTSALHTLYASLRQAAPQMIFGTECGQEMMLPFFDYAPAYPSKKDLGDDVNITWAPLNELVYGDAFINAVGIDGNLWTYDDRFRISRRLYGSVQGQDLRGKWVQNYNPVVQQEFEINPVLSVVQDLRMLRHEINPAGWRASYWDRAVVIGNTTSEQDLEVTVQDTPLGKIQVSGLRKYGFVIINDQGEFVCWGAKQLVHNGELLVSVSNPDSIVINNRRALTMASYGFFNPDKQPDQNIDLTEWKMSCPSMYRQMVDQIITWPDRKSVPIRDGDGKQLVIPAPGNQTLRVIKDDSILEY